MPWNNDQRAYFFGCRCAGCRTDEDRCLSAVAAEEDSEFVDRYCAPARPTAAGRSMVPGTVERLKTSAGTVPVATARCVINWITQLVPHGDHASPGWDWPRTMLPLISVGRLSNKGRISSPRFGLIALDGHLYLWCDEESLKKVAGNPFDKNWRELRGSKKYYDIPVDCTCGGKDSDHTSASVGCRGDLEHPFVAGPIRDLLEKIERKLAQNPTSATYLQEKRELATSLLPLRQALDEPSSAMDEDGNFGPGGWDVVYPKLVRAFIDSNGSPGPKGASYTPSSVEDSQPNSDTKEGADPLAEDSSARPPKAVIPDDAKLWFGIVMLDAHGNAYGVSLPWSHAQVNWQAVCYNPDQIIFMVSGHQVGVNAIIADITSLHAGLNGPIPALPPPSTAHYTYVYRDSQHSGWQDVFYVGKGLGNRYRQHLDQVYRKIARQSPALGVPVADSPKEERIEKYLRTSNLIGWGTHQNDINKRYDDALQQPPTQPSPLLMRIVSVHSSHGAVYCDERSQAAEKFLINFQYGVYDLTNGPAGNDPAAFGFLIRPAWYPLYPNQAWRWERACSIMVDEGSLSPLRKTSLDLPYAFPFVSDIDTALGRHGVYAAGGNGNPFKHFNAEGAGDFLLRYNVAGRDYGISIRIRRSSPEATIGMYKGNYTPADFESYIKNNTGLPIIRPGPDPYFRPFNPCGAAGNVNAVFGVDVRPGKPGFSSTNLQSNGHVSRGMTGCNHLDIAAAVHQILARFP